MRFRRQMIAFALLPAFAAAPLTALASDVNLSGSETLRIAVAPFEGDAISAAEGRKLATLLAARLADRPQVTAVGPAGLDLPARFAPEAREVRGWAKRARVESIVVGRTEATDRGQLEVLVELRSGHSGARLSRHSVRFDASGEERFAAASQTLADQLLDELGYGPPEPELPDVAAAAVETAESDQGMGAEIGRPTREAPIQIRSDELEVIEEEENRHLVFTRNVQVVQGDVTLHADRLEAFYLAGASQPQRLIAKGSVRVDQQGRIAHCDRAEYLRDERILVCSGHAVLIQGCNRVRGERIQIDLAGERARVTGAPSVVIYPEVEAGAPCPEDAP